MNQPCDCIAYPFPHRPGGGACSGGVICPMCKHEMYEAKFDSERGESLWRCPNCGYED